MRVETVRANGAGSWVAGLVGTRTEQFRRVSLTAGDIASLEITTSTLSCDGDGRLLRLGLEAHALGIAHEFDPWLGLSISRVDPLPHPERETPEVRRLRPNPETEMTAMRVVMGFETARGCQVYDVHEKNLGYDVTSLDLESGELRLIEVKGLAATTGTILLTPNERQVAEDRRDCYWLYVVTGCASEPALQDPIPDPARFPWHEVSKVQHYWLDVDAMTTPMMVGEEQAPYGRSGG